MNNLVMRRVDPRGLVLLPLACLIVLLAIRQQIGLEATPLRIMAAFIAGVLVLAAAARYPAAFIVPVLFIPDPILGVPMPVLFARSLKPIPAFQGFGPLENLTALQAACCLLGIAICLRWLRRDKATPEEPQSANRDGNVGHDSASPIDRLRNSRRAVIAFVVFAALVSASYIYTLSPNYGEDKLIRFLILGCGLFFASGLLFNSEHDLRDFTVGTAIFGLIVAASSLRFSISGVLAAGEAPSHIGKGQAIGLAMLVLLYAPVKNRQLKALILLVCIPTLAIGLVSAMTRGALFSLLLVLLLSCLVPSMRSPAISRRQMIFGAAALVGAVLMLSAFWFRGVQAYQFQSKTTEIRELIHGNAQAQGTAVQRLNYYSAALRDWRTHPVFGWGIGSWSMIYWHYDTREYPHNLFLEVLVEEGLAGLAALSILFLLVIGQVRACRNEISGLFPCLLPCLAYLISIAMFSEDLGGDRFIWFWCGLSLTTCALALRVRNRDRQFESEAGRAVASGAPPCAISRLSAAG